MDALGSAFLTLISLAYLPYLILGTAIGLVIGVLPGLGGIVGLTLLLPFAYGMDPNAALAMMIGLLAVTATSDTFPAVLMGIPGTSGSQATVVDGFPMAKRGEAARALSAGFSASLFGGVFSAVILTGAIFVARPIILAIGFAEQLMLVVFALSMIGMLMGSNIFKGLATCGVGLLIGSMGAAPATGEMRMTFDMLYLSDGVRLVILGLALFATPEIIDLLRRGKSISQTGTLGKGWVTGLQDVIEHRWIVIRCSIIGCIVGALPGLGGSVVDWIAYGHIKQTAKNKENFGHGDIRGVLAPESANNAKTGGALIPTLLFGIPGSGSMAILLGGLVLVGVEPGLDMIESQLPQTYIIIWSLAIANIIGAAACVVLSQPIAKLTTVRYHLLAPLMIVLIFFAAFQATRSWADMIALVALSVLGVYMKRFDWPRPALLIGFVLSSQFEANLYQTIQIYGWSFFERPIVLLLIALTILSIYAAVRLAPKDESTADQAQHSPQQRAPQLVFSVILLVFVAMSVFDAMKHSELALIYPFWVGLVALGLLLCVGVPQLTKRVNHSAFFDAERQVAGIQPLDKSNLYYLSWIIGLPVVTWIIGFLAASFLFIFVFIIFHLKRTRVLGFILAVATVVLLFIISELLALRYPEGMIPQLLGWV